MKISAIKEWFQRQLPVWKQKGAVEGQKVKKEFTDQLRKMLVGALIALILVILGFPRLSAWYEGYKERQKNPAREVYINVSVLEGYTLIPLEGVYVQVAGDVEATGYTDSEGKLTLAYEAEAGENTATLTLSKETYIEETEYEVALPEADGDSTLLRTFQLLPKEAEKKAEEVEMLNFN
ncbi:MAG: hypothetical protein H6573_13090 [Lewinellaceae bacterium]|nr:hypothetical protein [Phaeodactylibacter sp.]MCB0614938.1 hypothetical protein [Phaeodactylibacter sp.]MCB9348420.1 hypothetical protein [Lewinellaceae bacterium]